MKRIFYVVLACLFSIGTAQSAGMSPEEITKRIENSKPDEIVKLIQQGGYVLYFRHGHTNHGQYEATHATLEACSKQRNLDELGKQQSEAMGAAFKSLDIPVGKILSSPWCRAKDTAMIAFGRRDISYDLSFSISKSKEETTNLTKALRAMLSEEPKLGTNTVLFAHTSNLKDAAGVWPKPEGALAVFKPDRDLGFKFIGLIRPEYWLSLTESN